MPRPRNNVRPAHHYHYVRLDLLTLTPNDHNQRLTVTTPNHSASASSTTLSIVSVTALALTTPDDGNAADGDDHDILDDPPDDVLPPTKPVGDDPEDPPITGLAATG